MLKFALLQPNAKVFPYDRVSRKMWHIIKRNDNLQQAYTDTVRRSVAIE